MEYALLTAADMPEIVIHLIESVDEAGPFGAKGLGESGVIPVAAAVANAVKDAVGVRLTELPMTPERVFGRWRPAPPGAPGVSARALDEFQMWEARPSRCRGRGWSGRRSSGCAGRSGTPGPPGLAAPARRRGPADIRATADWCRLPFLTKDELRDAYPFGARLRRRGRVPARAHVLAAPPATPC